MDDLISDFITETSESLAALDSEIVTLEQNPNDTELLGSIFRLVHTIKGTCGFLALSRLESVAHAAENILGRVRDGEMTVTPNVVSIILEAFDKIKALVAYLEESGEEAPGDDADLIKRLNIVAETGGNEPSTEAETTPAAPTEIPETAAIEDSAPETATPIVETEQISPDEATGGDATLDELERIFRETECEVDYTLNVPAAEATPEEVAAPEAEQEIAAAPEPAPAPAPVKSTPAPAALSDDGDKEESKGGKSLATQNIRVRLDVLEELMQMVSELVLTRNQLLQLMRRQNDSEFNVPLQRLSHITTELQEGVMKTRMQPISSAWAKFPRMIRDLSIDLNKKIELKMLGGDTELDRQMLDMIKDPLTHMVRNSCDHGLETPQDRLASGKSEGGTVTLSAYHEGGHIIIEITDDGRGLNIERITAKALENGVTTESELQTLTEQQIMQFIFSPGFSTAENVTSVSGRGVGMDVVATNIEKIGGTVELFSKTGKGSTFLIKIPLTLAIVSVLIVQAGEERFAIPQINVLEMVQVSAESEYTIETLNETPVLRLRGKLLPLVTLSESLGLQSSNVFTLNEDAIDETASPTTKKKHQGTDKTFIVVCKVGGYAFGVIVDRVYDTEEIVVKPVAPLLQNINLYSGCTILGDGNVIMILDPNGLSKQTGETKSTSTGDDAQEIMGAFSQRTLSFLLFGIGDKTQKAVPLELVSRLEEIDPKIVEYSSNYPVVQYRDKLMRLVDLSGAAKLSEDNEELLQVVVFAYDNVTVGLVVDDIIDITNAPLDVKMASSDKRFLGSMVINSKATEVLDVGHIFTDIMGLEATNDNGNDDGNEHRSATILLLDDSAFFRNVTAPLISAAGYIVVTAESAVEALAILESHPHFDLIISDIEMPEMDGYQFCRACRATPKLQNIPMIAFTSRITENAIKEGSNAGFNDYISKTDRPGLIKTVENLLKSQLPTREENVG